MYFVNMLLSEQKGISYVGMAKDVERRLNEHNAGKSLYTKSHLPFKLVYKEGPYETVVARSREKYLKRTDVKRRILARYL